jgi:hypothetical protein
MGGGRFEFIEEVVTRPRCLYYKGCMQMHSRARTVLSCSGCKTYIECMENN